MHFGHLVKYRYQVLIVLLATVLINGCKDKPEPKMEFDTPFQGQNFSAGDTIRIKLIGKQHNDVDSVTYLLDQKIIAKTLFTDSLQLPTAGWKLGYRMISAILKHGDKNDTIITNIVLKSNIKPAKWEYSVVNRFPHDTSAYTEGLSYVDGQILESTGEKGFSKLRYVQLETGKIKREIKLDPTYFGEGSVKVGNKIMMLTYQENVGFVFDANSFKLLETFPYQNSKEGWGLTYDGERILRSDGTNKIWHVNPQTYKEESYLEVYDNNGPVDSLNELEYIDGKIFANVYSTTKIVVIDPKSGAVEAYIDAQLLVPKSYFKTPYEMQNNVLNGIAWDEIGRRLFIGGKKWPMLYELKLHKTSARL